MATVNEKMTALADAIRAKTGETDKLTLDGMTSSITEYTTDATAAAASILSGETAYVDNSKVTGTMTNHGKVVKALTQGYSTWVMEEGYYADKSGVSVSSTTKTVTPTKSQQILMSTNESDPFYSMVTINPIPDAYITTTDATATADQIFIDQTAYVDGSKVTGTFTIDDEIATQEDLIAQINTALEGKSAGSATTAPATCSFTLNPGFTDANCNFYYSVWNNGAIESNSITNPAGATIENILCGSLIVADTTTGSIATTLVSNATLSYANSDSTVLVFIVGTGTSGIINLKTGASGM